MTSAAVNEQLVYLSLPPGSIGGGDSVRVMSAGITLSEVMVDGGFDPLPVYAAASDSVAVEVFLGGQTIGPVAVRVPASHPPTVVRTSPPKGRRDIPLNQQIVVVFSQPIDPATVTSSSVQLTLGGTPVAATLTVLPNQPWVVRLTPSSFLAPNSTYTLAIDGTIKDAGSLALVAPVSADFTTGTTADSVAAVAIYAVGGFARQPSPVAVATPGGTVQFLAYEVSLAGDTLTANSSAPLTWSTNDASVATIDAATGLLTAVGSGGATVTACTAAICGDGSIIVDVLPEGVTPRPMGDLGAGYSRLFAMGGGYATGYALIPGGTCRHAFLWSAFRGMEDLGTLPGGCASIGWDVNSSGVVLGDGDGGAWIWKRGTGMQPVTYPDASGRWNEPLINDNGDLLWGGDGSVFGFQSATTGIHIWPTPAESLYAVNVNNLGQIALNSMSGSDTAWIMNGTTGQVVRILTSSAKIAIQDFNDNGMIIGYTNWDVDSKPFRWSAFKGFEYLDPPGPGIIPEVMFMNNAGDVAVYLISYRHIGTDSLFEGRSAVWMANGSLVMLGGLGGTHTFVNGINDNHQAAGHSQVGSNTGPQEAVLWNLPSGAVASGSRTSVAPSRIQPHVSPRTIAPRTIAPRKPTPLVRREHGRW
jgi:hypothetical protein